jgi:dihydrofolate synthase/folylpolyglutamate synthase
MDIESAYSEALKYLYEQLPMFSKQGKAALKFDLDNITRFCDEIGNPQEQFKSIHIAGTNGKGSTSHMLSAVLQDAGYKVGLYTSPHLIDFRERIRINGKSIGKETVLSFMDKYKGLIETLQPSFFEVTVALAFELFASEHVDIAVIETGLGGRLDSTNIIHPILSIITNISYDHQDVLGNTLKEIATEKAGIIKPNTPVLIGEQQEELQSIFFEKAIHNNSAIYYAEALWDLVRIKQDSHHQLFKAVHKAHREMYDLQTDLTGNYQQHNIKTVLAATELLVASQGLNLTIEGAIGALAKVKRLTQLRGRWEILGTDPFIVADVAHNPAGVQEVMKQWNTVSAERKHILLGFVKDKDVEKALSLFPADAIYHFCQANLPRALPVAALEATGIKIGLQGYSYLSVAEAMQGATDQLSNKDALLITGSFFIVGEALEWLGKKQETPVG